MSTISPLPADTHRAARAAFGRHNYYLLLGDQLSDLFEISSNQGQNGDEFEGQGQPLSLLALVTAFQFIEGLTDSQAVDAIRTRIDWKYALHLPLNHPHVQTERLCAERQRILSDPKYRQKFRCLIENLITVGGLGYRSHVGADPVRMVTEVCSFCRLDAVKTAMILALEMLASLEPEWLRAIALPHWYERYNPGSDSQRALSNRGEEYLLAQKIGADIRYLLQMSQRDGAWSIHNQPEIQRLGELLEQQYEFETGILRWRQDGCLACEQSGSLYRFSFIYPMTS